ncbi:MAG TPA: SpoIIE family protein phosphatase [Baekduia sp.]|nr:SpoIIE family protein phosphatase [Baekduia sp.]
MTSEDSGSLDSTQDLLENAPCGYLSTLMDGTIVSANQTFRAWIGATSRELGRFQDLLAPGSRIYHETHLSPMLQMQGFAREIALEIVRFDGSRMPALINSLVRRDSTGAPARIRTVVFDATERRLYESELITAQQREHEVALELQRSLLAGDLPSVANLQLDVAYRASVFGQEAGGDWYDAFWLVEGETVALVVGDIVGRGIGAAAAMGQLRSAVRALALTGLDPSSLLEALDRYARRHQVGQMATVVYAEFTVQTGNVRYACAGHPPPLIVSAGGASRFAWNARSVPLDAAPSPRPRGQDVFELQPGDTLLLYTDGLIEHRAAPIAKGMAQLAERASELRDRPIAELTGSIVDGLRNEDQPDDVCLLAARLLRSPA